MRALPDFQEHRLQAFATRAWPATKRRITIENRFAKAISVTGAN